MAKQETFDGVVKKRHSTDKLFILLLIAMWVAMTIVGIQGIQRGDPQRLLAPIDDQGNLCGVSAGVENSKYFYTVLTSGVGVCIPTSSGCPVNDTSLTQSVSSLGTDSFYCLSSIYKNFGTTGLLLQNYISTTCYSGGSFNIASNCGCQIKLASVDYLQRCTFTNTAYAKKFATQAVRAQFFTWISDIWEAKAIIFGYGIGLTFVLSFIYIMLFRFYWFATLITWSMLVVVLAAFAGMCYLAYTTANDWKNATPQEHTDNEVLALQVTSALFMGLAIVMAIVMIFARSSIQISLQIMSMTAECIEDMPMIVTMPLLKVVGIVVFLIPWIIYVICIGSSGTFNTNVYYPVSGQTSIAFTYQTYTISEDTQGRLWFMLFCYLWSTEFIMAVGYLITSIAVANWYFSKPEDRTLKGGRRDLNLGFAHALRYHLGTAAFGSLVIAIISFIRAVVLYLENKFKQVAGNNCCIRFVFCCVNCCLWCIEQCVRYVAAKAYIQTAIHGYSFCWSAKEAFCLIMRNPLRIFILDLLAGLAMFIGKIMIVCITGATSYYLLERYYINDLSGLIAPTVLTMIISYTVASAFAAVFEAVAATMIQCFVTDEEKNGTAIYSSPKFREFVDKNEISEEEYKKMNGGESVEESKAKGNKSTNGGTVHATAATGL